mgnify:CR=1 FL=1
MSNTDPEMNDFPPKDADNQDVKGENWTIVEPIQTPTAGEGAGEQADQTAGQAAHDEDWAEKSLDEVKAGLKQISSAIKYAFNEGKNEPKIKQFGEDVRSAFDKIGDELNDLFKKY